MIECPRGQTALHPPCKQKSALSLQQVSCHGLMTVPVGAFQKWGLRGEFRSELCRRQVDTLSLEEPFGVGAIHLCHCLSWNGQALVPLALSALRQATRAQSSSVSQRALP